MEIQSVLLLSVKNRHALWSMLKSAYPLQIKRLHLSTRTKFPGSLWFFWSLFKYSVHQSKLPAFLFLLFNNRLENDRACTLTVGDFLYLFYFFSLIMSSWIRLPASAVWSVCSQRFHYNSKDTIMSRAGGSADIIMHQWFLSLRNLHFSIFLSEGSVLQKRWVVQQVSWVSAHWSSNAFIYFANLLLCFLSSFVLFLGWFMTLSFPSDKWRTSFHTELLFQKNVWMKVISFLFFEPVDVSENICLNGVPVWKITQQSANDMWATPQICLLCL